MRFVSQPSKHRPPRGFTLVEMMVAVALLVLMMTILVSIFASATGAITEHRAFAALDMELRRVDTTIRQDLRGVTVQMTPAGYDPARDARESRLGYFEYAENSFADAQGEDTDDTLRFTAKAPEGQPFTGRIWVRDPTAVTTLQPITFTSQYAEIIYFLRNNNLYRRVFLIAPERQKSLLRDIHGNYTGNIGNIPNDSNNAGVGPTRIGFQTSLFQPLTMEPTIAYPGDRTYPIVSWLGLNDLSARPSSFPTAPVVSVASPLNYIPTLNTLADLADRENRAFNPRFANDYTGGPDGVPDGIPDDFNSDGVPDFYPTLYPNAFNASADHFAGASLVNMRDPDGNVHYGAATGLRTSYDVFAFPFIFPNSYSTPRVTDEQPRGRLPVLDTETDLDLRTHNHAPLLLGDSLRPPSGNRPTWWGFPTWRETLSPYWLDPIKRINDPSNAPFYSYTGPPSLETHHTQTFALRYAASAVSETNPTGRWLLPPVLAPQNEVANDGVGGYAFRMPTDVVWEDDLLLSGVRSFDVKAYDPEAIVYGIPAGYYDLGYAAQFDDPWTPTSTLQRDLLTLGHEGRIPPLINDNRSDPQFPYALPNLGDNNANVVRLRRVWDSWSTAYTQAPGLPLNPIYGPMSGNPDPSVHKPVVPSYPAPYPVPLRAIQIQIRVVDPSNQRIKSLTIKQDFSDKL